jgi:WD40 repeat protein
MTLALWITLCNTHFPPIRPAYTTWSDITHHRRGIGKQYSVPGQSDLASDSDGEDPLDTLTGQGGMGGGGGINAQSQCMGTKVWERSKRSMFSNPLGQWIPPVSSEKIGHQSNDPPILSYQPLPTTQPEPNYKHLYIAHCILHNRLHATQTPYVRHPDPDVRQYVINPVSSVQSGGLPGHNEIIYSLSRIRHRMCIKIARSNGVGGGYDSLISLTSFARGEGDYGGYDIDHNTASPVVISGRDWILSGSRDTTLRLWLLDGAESRVVKVFHGGHSGSVLSHFTGMIPVCVKDEPSTPKFGGSVSPSKKSRIPQERLVAVSAGSDGTLCLWDVENGDGSPEKTVQAHDSSVLCVRGNSKYIVSSSKGQRCFFLCGQLSANLGPDRTIKIFDIRDLTCIRTIQNTDTEGRPATAINALSLSDKYM